MKLLFDQGTPAPSRRHLPQHLVDTLAEKGWLGKGNGELIDLADAEAYDRCCRRAISQLRRRWLDGRQLSRLQPRVLC